MRNVIHFGAPIASKSHQGDWYDERIRHFAFECDPALPDDAVVERVRAAAVKKFAGYRGNMIVDINEVVRENPSGGYVAVRECWSIGD